MLRVNLRGYGTLKYGDVHEKFNFFEIQELGPVRMSVKFKESTQWLKFFSSSNGHSNNCLPEENDQKLD